MSTTSTHLLDTIVVKQDIGIYEPQYKKIKLFLWSDQTVTWGESHEQD